VLEEVRPRQAAGVLGVLGVGEVLCPRELEEEVVVVPVVVLVVELLVEGPHCWGVLEVEEEVRWVGQAGVVGAAAAVEEVEVAEAHY
jgi:hypothetical protein